MKTNYTQILLNLILIFSLGFIFNPLEVTAQSCATPVGISTSNISNFTATANWNLDSDVDHYRVRYREVDSLNWSFNHNASGIGYNLDDLNANSSYSGFVSVISSDSPIDASRLPAIRAV